MKYTVKDAKYNVKTGSIETAIEEQAKQTLTTAVRFEDIPRALTADIIDTFMACKGYKVDGIHTEERIYSLARAGKLTKNIFLEYGKVKREVISTTADTVTYSKKSVGCTFRLALNSAYGVHIVCNCKGSRFACSDALGETVLSSARNTEWYEDNSATLLDDIDRAVYRYLKTLGASSWKVSTLKSKMLADCIKSMAQDIHYCN